MTYPTREEISQAYEGITEDGEGAEVTIVLCSMMITDPLLRDTAERSAALIERTGGLENRAIIMSCIAKGMNIALRISDARQAGVKSRRSIENLLAHYKNGECQGNEALSSNDQCVKILEWVLGVKPEEKTGMP